jgi:hypothetical protein
MDYIEGVDKLRPRSVIDNTENVYGGRMIDFLCDVNFCMLNGRVGNSNDFTCVSTKGKSVVDYVVVPHEQLPMFTDFGVHRVTDVINSCGIQPPECLPDHSLLEFVIKI